MGNTSSVTHTARPSQVGTQGHIQHERSKASQSSSFINNIQTTPTQPFFYKDEIYRSTKMQGRKMKRQGSESIKTVVRTNQYKDLEARVSQKRRSTSRGSCDIIETKEDYPSQQTVQFPTLVQHSNPSDQQKQPSSLMMIGVPNNNNNFRNDDGRFQETISMFFNNSIQ